VKFVGKFAFSFSTTTSEDSVLNFQSTLKLTAVALGCVITSTAFAQVAKPDGQWRGNGGAAFSTTSGNTQTTSFLLNSDLTRATDNDKISLGAAANYGRAKLIDKNTGESEKVTTSQKWNLFGQYDYNITPSIYAFGKLGLEGDKISDLSLRTSLVGGVGYKIINTDAHALSVFGGVGYVTDKYSAEKLIGSKVNKTFSRASLYLGEESAHTLSSTVSFKQRLELYPGLSGDKAFLLKFTAGLGVAMSTNLSLNVGVTDSYNSKPPEGNKKNDLGVFTGVNVKFGAQ
jgi:putative salt-induced outer membrane protein